MKSTSKLIKGELDWIERFLGDRPIFRLYHQAALDDLAKGLDNRQYLISETEKGMLMSIRFDGIRVTTTIGDLTEAELRLVAELPDAGEIHAEANHERCLQQALGPRLSRKKLLKYYLCSSPIDGAVGADYRRLSPDDYELASAFFSKHYPETIFSRWMLENPFVGVFEDGELVATGGTVILNHRLSLANVGNFLTRPDRRGRGLAKKAAIALIAELKADGIAQYSLGTTEDNVPAWKAYESVGFSCIESRPELHVTSMRAQSETSTP